MKIETRKLLFDVVQACRAVRQFTAGQSFESYTGSDMLRSAVERKFEIIGEALTRLRAIDPETFASIPDASPVVGLRNRIIHGYNAVDNRIVWDIVESDLPKLESQVEQLLAEEA